MTEQSKEDINKSLDDYFEVNTQKKESPTETKEVIEEVKNETSPKNEDGTTTPPETNPLDKVLENIQSVLKKEDVEIIKSKDEEIPKAEWTKYFEDENEYKSYLLSKKGEKVTPNNIKGLSPKELVEAKILADLAKYGMKPENIEDYLKDKYNLEEEDDNPLSKPHILAKEAKEASEFFNKKFTELEIEQPTKPVVKEDVILPKQENKPTFDNESWTDIATQLQSVKDVTTLNVSADGVEFEYSLDEQFVKSFPKTIPYVAKQLGLDLSKENVSRTIKVIKDDYFLQNRDVIFKEFKGRILAEVEEKYNIELGNPDLTKRNTTVTSKGNKWTSEFDAYMKD